MMEIYTMNFELNINLNEHVECELTPHGLEVFTEMNGEFKRKRFNFVTVQLHELIRVFGAHMGNGDQVIAHNRITIIGNSQSL